jgi:uncharacterized protein YuzE
MSVQMGSHEFDDVVYDAVGDVLYMHKGKPVAAAKTLASVEGHPVMLNGGGEIIGITVVNAKWLVERDGRITVTVPEEVAAPDRLETSAADLAKALAA